MVEPRTGVPRKRMNMRAAMDVAATVLMMIAAGVVIWVALDARQSTPVAASPSPPIPTAPVSLDDAPMLGSADADVVMLIYSDFECPFCARFAAEILPPLKAEYVDSGQVRIAFRHFPLPIHQRARRAAEGAVCASLQGRFWAMHDSLFGQPLRLDESDLEAHAREADLDLAAFATCMSGAPGDRVAADVERARALGIMATPSVIIGVVDEQGALQAHEVITGVRPVSTFGLALDKALAMVSTR